MSIFRHEPKRLETMALPPELVEFLREVSGRIERGEPEAMIESDDLLQCDHTYGGRIEADGDEWGFTYFLGRPKPKWELVFTSAQIKEIAAGAVREIPLSTCNDPACGNRFSWREYTCADCDRGSQ